MTDRIPVLLDTDPGSDIDDAMAIAYLLRQPRCELLGITTVTGDTRKRAAMCRAICEAEHQPDTPIHPGSPDPILFGPGQPDVPQFDAIADRPNPFADADLTAVEFLRTTIRARPHEITLLAIGPMTNLGLLFKLDPEIPSLLKELVLMCGVYLGWPRRGWGRISTPGTREWNAMCDPVATHITYAARPPRHTSYGLDVTSQCTMPGPDCLARFAAAGGGMQLVHDFAEVWCNLHPDAPITYHDPLAAACLFEPGLCEYDRGEVRVETTSRDLGGLTRFSPASDNAPHRIATAVDADAFMEHYFGVLGVAS